jgi:hypothetical protein
MTYYEHESGAQVFSAGALNFGGQMLLWPEATRVVENVWAGWAALRGRDPPGRLKAAASRELLGDMLTARPPLELLGARTGRHPPPAAVRLAGGRRLTRT